MSKAIKIIDLLNKIANKEEMPEQIKYRNCMFNKIFGAGFNPNYSNYNGTFFLEYVSNEADNLNEIVEIIEDQIDIQNIEEIGNTTFDLDNMEDDEIEKYHNFTRTKINELIRAVKQLDNKN